MKKIFSFFGAILALCCTINVSAQTLLYQAEWNGSSFEKVGGNATAWTLNLQNHLVSNGVVQIESGKNAVVLIPSPVIKPGNSNAPEVGGATIVITVSNVNTSINGQFISHNDGNTVGMKLENSDGSYRATWTSGAWASGAGTGNFTATSAIQSLGFSYKRKDEQGGTGTNVYVESSKVFGNTGLQATANITNFCIGGLSSLNTNFLNVGMKIHQVSVYQDQLTADQIYAINLLETAIANSRERIRTTVEGTAAGQFPVGSKATLQSLINDAVTARTGTDAAKTTATNNLTAGLTTYNSNIIKSQIEITITVASGGGGTVAITGLTSPAVVDAVIPVTVVAIPSTGYRFVKWVDATSGTDTNITGATNPSYTYSGGTSVTLKAIFIQQITTTVATADASGGTISLDGSTSVLNKTTDIGTSVTLNSTLNSGYSFAGWYNGTTKVSGNASYTFTPATNATLTARYTYLRKLQTSTPAKEYWYYITNKKGNDLLLKANGNDAEISAEYFAISNAFLWKIVSIDGATYLVNKKEGLYLSGLNDASNFTTSTLENAKPFTTYASTHGYLGGNSWGIDVTNIGKLNARGSSAGTKFTQYFATDDAGNAFHFIPAEGSGIPQEEDIDQTWFAVRTRNGWMRHNVTDGFLKDNGTMNNFNELNEDIRRFKIKKSTTDETKYVLVVKDNGTEKEIGWDGTRLVSNATNIFNFKFNHVVDSNNAGLNSIDAQTTSTAGGGSYLGMNGNAGAATVNINVSSNELKHWSGSDIGNGFKFINPDDVFGIKPSTEAEPTWYRVVNDGYTPASSYCYNKVWAKTTNTNMQFIDKAINSDEQLFRFELDAASGKVKIANKATGKYMISAFTCNDDNGELFITTALGLNTFKVMPQAGNSVHAQASGSVLVKWDGAAGSASAWRFEKTNFSTITVAAEGEDRGTVAIEGTTELSRTLENGSTVNLTATPSHSHITLLKWIDDENNEISTEHTFAHYVTKNLSLTAMFISPVDTQEQSTSLYPMVVNKAIVVGSEKVEVYTITGNRIDNKNLKAGVYVARAAGITYRVAVK